MLLREEEHFNNKYIESIIPDYYDFTLLNREGFVITKELIHPSIIKVLVDGLLFLISFQIQQKWVFGYKNIKD